MAIDPALTPLAWPEPVSEGAFWVAWNRGCGCAGYLNRRKRRWLEQRAFN